MKMTRWLSVAVTTLLGIAGCIPTSIHPLYTEKDLVFDPALVGVWSEKEDSKETRSFEKLGDKGYRLVIREADGKTGEFQAHLLKLGDTLFLDLFPDQMAMEESNRDGYYQAHLQPMHSFLKVSRIEPTLEMAPLNLVWLATFLKENPSAIRHEVVGRDKEDRQIILTASTRDLQAFMLKHRNTPDAFGDEPIRLERIKPKP